MSSPNQSLWRAHVACSASLVIATLVAYSNSFDAEFLYDDFQNFVHNPRVHWHDLSWETIALGIFGGPTPRPVAIFTLGINYYLGGQDVFGYHVFNVSLHTANAIAVYALLWATLGLPGGRGKGTPAPNDWHRAASALAGALLFALHPLQTQAVTYVVQRMTALAAGFYLVSFLLYIYAVRGASGWRKRAGWSLLGLTFLLSLGSKEIAAPLPVALWLYEWLFGQRLDRAWARRQAKWLLIPLVAGLALFAGLFESIQAEFTQRDFSMSERVLTELRVVLFYASLALAPLPSRQNLLQLISTSHSLIDPLSTLAALVTLLGLLAFAVWLAPRRPLAASGIVWFFLHLVVESSVLPLEMIYEHRVYLPLFGFSLILTDILSNLAPRRRGGAFALVGLLAISLGGLTYERNHIWRRADSIWADVYEKTGDHRARESVAWALESRGVALVKQGRERDALAYFRQAAQIAPEYAHNYRSWGNALIRLGRATPAVGRFQKAIAIDPSRWGPHDELAFTLMHMKRTREGLAAYSKMLQLIPSDAEALGAPSALIERGQPREAAMLLEAAVITHPNSVPLRTELIEVLSWIGEPEAAIRQARALVSLDPSAGHQARLGLILWENGDPRAAIQQLEAAVMQDADDTRHGANLAWMLASAPEGDGADPQRALALLEPLLRAEPRDADLLDTAATALIALGRPQEAATRLDDAIQATEATGGDAAALRARRDGLRVETRSSRR